MAFDIDMIKKVYQKYPTAVEAARKVTRETINPLAEKILYTHLWERKCRHCNLQEVKIM